MSTIEIDSATGPRQIDLFSYLEPEQEEHANEEAYDWIKSIRRLRVDGTPFRSRFRLRGDSLWWFAELYLHKERAILDAIRIIHAVGALVDRERPPAIRFVRGRLAGVVAGAARARHVRYDGPEWPRENARLLAMDARARRLAVAARLSRWRGGSAAAGHAAVAAFVHHAFWRRGGAGGDAEAYIGPILRALEERLPAGEVRYVGVGPRTNFRARRWWRVMRGGTDERVTPIERFAPSAAMRASREIFTERHALRDRMWASGDLRAHAIVRGVDCWPLVREQLAGIALLQFPWSARAMDEAAATLDAIAPEIAVTYAEAGGWGRALALEARRRVIPFVGLQHGFIYRHWLNYRHEPDEMTPDSANPDDRGFPYPARTLLFDDLAASHLERAGRFPRATLAVTGSARLDELVASARAVSREDVDRIREACGATGDRPLLLFAAKEREARHALPALVAAAAALPDVQLAIKPHPAETPDVYAAAVSGAANVRVLDTAAPLPLLLRAARGVITVNSTVAIDALALGVPSLVIGLPNNLSPFVDAGVMLGARTADEIRDGIGQLLYNQKFRSSVENAPVGAAGAGTAAAASADAILSLRHVRS